MYRFRSQAEPVVDEKVSQRASIEIADVANGTHHVPARTTKLGGEPAVVRYAEKQHSAGLQDSSQLLEIRYRIVEVLEHLLRDYRIERVVREGSVQ